MYNNAPITVTTSRGGGRSENLKGQAVIIDLWMELVLLLNSAKWKFSKVIGKQPEKKLRRILILISHKNVTGASIAS